jgi:hypothetical protein
MKLLRRMMFLLRRERFDHELAEEMRLHVDLRAERLRERGVDRPEAERAARSAFGNATLLREASREAWTWRALEETTQDLRYALRTIRKNHGFAAAVVVCLAVQDWRTQANMSLSWIGRSGNSARTRSRGWPLSAIGPEVFDEPRKGWPGGQPRTR